MAAVKSPEAVISQLLLKKKMASRGPLHLDATSARLLGAEVNLVRRRAACVAWGPYTHHRRR